MSENIKYNIQASNISIALMDKVGIVCQCECKSQSMIIKRINEKPFLLRPQSNMSRYQPFTSPIKQKYK